MCVYIYICCAHLQKILPLVIALIFAAIIQGEPESQFDVIVAKDGSGNFTQISEAVSAAPDHSNQKYYIKIKAGTYVERVQVGIEKTNLAFIGDGMDETIITYDRSNQTGYGTIESASVGKFLIFLFFII